MVSIFIPTYNGGPYIRQTIESLSVQTYSDFEIVCVDDSSTDETLQILHELQLRDNRIRIFQKPHEGDVPHAWKYVLPLLQGSQTLYMSQDDLLDPDTLQQLVDRQIQTRADAVIPTVVFWEEGKTDNNPRIDRGINGDTRAVISGDQALALMLDYTIPGFALWNTALIRSIGMRVETYNSDEVAQREWVAQSKTVAFSDAVFRYRRDNPNSLTNTFSCRLFGRPLSDARLLELAQRRQIATEVIQQKRDEAFSSLWWHACYATLHSREYEPQDRRLFRRQFKQAYRTLHTGAKPTHRIQRLAARNGFLFCSLVAYKAIRARLHAQKSLLRHWARHSHLIVTKKEKPRIILHLFLNRILLLLWYLRKRIHHIQHPVVHYYAVCWNEAKFLPFMLEHYKKNVDHFYIYDNGSNDDTLRILHANPQCSVRHFDSDGFNDRIHIDIKNECWKASRGKADYVIVSDIDELLFHPNPTRLLDDMHSLRQSIVQPQGYDMYSDCFPDFRLEPQITLQIKTGIRADKYSKSILFDPYRIVDIRYEPGCHQCHPVGIVHYSTDGQCKLLHYKNMGLDYLLNRTRQLAKRLSDENLQAQYGCEYLRDENEISAQFHNNLDKAKNII